MQDVIGITITIFFNCILSTRNECMFLLILKYIVTDPSAPTWGAITTNQLKFVHKYFTNT